MADVIYLLGAGFNYGVVDLGRGRRPPLARNFFQVLLQDGFFEQRLDAIRRNIYVDILLNEIRRHWHLDLLALKTEPFDIEECLTLFESQLLDESDPDRSLALRRATFALRNLILMYLGELSFDGYTPTARQFGAEVLAAQADVLTFNYDTLAEEAIGFASRVGDKPSPATRRQGPTSHQMTSDDDLDASHLSWKRPLAYGFEFDEVTMPISGVSEYIEGPRYYSHPNNRLYERCRVLKLHGSIDWLRYTDSRSYPGPESNSPPPKGVVLASHSRYWMGESPTMNTWLMEPVVIPPQLYKTFRQDPFPAVWSTALRSLEECKTLVVIGYSFPPTDFRTRRLFLEAFRDHALENLVVVNPDPSVAGIVRQLCHYSGPVVTCHDLRSFYGLPASWFDLLPATDQIQDQGSRE